MGATFLACSEVAQQYQDKLTSASGLGLATILTSDDHGSEKYQSFLGKDCDKVGMKHMPCKADSDEQLEEIIADCNDCRSFLDVLV